MGDPDVDHVLLTRFNLPSPGPESLIRAQEGWLVKRVQLFERYCLPSVAAQTDRDFTWIVYLDPESPGWLKTTMATAAEQKILVPVYREQVGPDDLTADIAAALGPRRSQLLTTNLDNDDGLAVDFVARLRHAPPRDERVALYLRNGLIKGNGQVYVRTDPDNAFCSVREPTDSARTCWVDWHNRLALQMPVIELAGEPGWLQVIHDSNVSNRIRGRLVAPDRFRALFPGLIDDIPDVTRGSLLRERVGRAPARLAKEAVRASVKRAVMAVGGKEGLDRLKTWRARSSRGRGASQRSTSPDE